EAVAEIGLAAGVGGRVVRRAGRTVRRGRRGLNRGTGRRRGLGIGHAAQHEQDGGDDRERGATVHMGVSGGTIWGNAGRRPMFLAALTLRAPSAPKNPPWRQAESGYGKRPARAGRQRSLS